MAIDEDGRSLLINKKQSVLLHRFSFKGPVKAAQFSPDGQFIACAVGRVLQVQAIPSPIPASGYYPERVLYTRLCPFCRSSLGP